MNPTKCLDLDLGYPTHVLRKDVSNIRFGSLSWPWHDRVGHLGKQVLVPLGVALNALHQLSQALRIGKLQACSG